MRASVCGLGMMNGVVAASAIGAKLAVRVFGEARNHGVQEVFARLRVMVLAAAARRARPRRRIWPRTDAGYGRRILLLDRDGRIQPCDDPDGLAPVPSAVEDTTVAQVRTQTGDRRGWVQIVGAVAVCRGLGVHQMGVRPL